MNGYEYIVRKQIAWATREGIRLIGSQVDRGRPTYAPDVDRNLFRPLLPEVRQAFAAGDGGELASNGAPAKMQALHSSSALVVNVFQYWKEIGEVPVMAAGCGLCRSGSTAARNLVFEEKYPVSEAFETPPNIDYRGAMSRGTSTGNDDVFCVGVADGALRTRAGIQVDIEPPVLRKPVRASDFTRYRFRPTNKEMLIFPYEASERGYRLLTEEELRLRFPRAYQYLSINRPLLEKRKQRP